MTADLHTLLAPLSLDEFFERYWESEALVRQPGSAALLGSLLQVRDVEFLTATLGSLDAKWIRLVNNRHSGPMREFQRTGQGLSMERILEAYREGTTIVLNDLQQRWPPIRDLARRLWNDFNDVMELPLRAVGVNAYLSPANAEGLAAHFDSHCVFILQVSGRKTWTLYDASGSRSRDVTIGPGDVVYIPRGVVHQARTAESHSLHLAVGVYPYTWGEVLADALRAIPECRRSLPRGILSTAEMSPDAHQVFASLVQSVLDRSTAATALGRTRAEIDQLRERQRCDGLERCHAGETIDGSTRVVRRRDVRLSLHRQGEQVVVELGGGGAFHAPAAVEPALRYVMENPSFTVSFMGGGLSERSKTVLVRRLVKEGVLELAS